METGIAQPYAPTHTFTVAVFVKEKREGPLFGVQKGNFAHGMKPIMFSVFFCQQKQSLVRKQLLATISSHV